MFNEEYENVLSGLFEGVYIVDTNRKIIYWNEGSEKITGYSRDEVVNSLCYNNILRHVDKNGKELCLDGCPLHETLQTGKSFENDVFLHHKKGHRVPVTVRTSPIYDDKGKVIAALEVFTDSYYRKDVFMENRRLQKMVISDELTGVFNRRYLDYQLESSISEFKEFEQQFGLIFIDIDKFKNVNDTYGHNIGDEVLKLVSNTINANIRANDIFGRWGGEEFLVIAKVSGKKELAVLAEKLRLLVMKSALPLKNEQLRVTISLGCTMNQSSDSALTLVERADKAMYESKETGRNKFTIY